VLVILCVTVPRTATRMTITLSDDLAAAVHDLARDRFDGKVSRAVAHVLSEHFDLLEDRGCVVCGERIPENRGLDAILCGRLACEHARASSRKRERRLSQSKECGRL
jgi:hypothetical protein